MVEQKEFISELDFFISKHKNILNKRFLNHVNVGNEEKIKYALKKMINYIPSKREVYNIVLDRTLEEIQQKFDMAKDAKLIYNKYIKHKLFY